MPTYVATAILHLTSRWLLLLKEFFCTSHKLDSPIHGNRSSPLIARPTIRILDRHVPLKNSFGNHTSDGSLGKRFISCSSQIIWPLLTSILLAELWCFDGLCDGRGWRRKLWFSAYCTSSFTYQDVVVALRPSSRRREFIFLYVLYGASSIMTLTAAKPY